jgi:hypothetical protein
MTFFGRTLSRTRHGFELMNGALERRAESLKGSRVGSS